MAILLDVKLDCFEMMSMKQYGRYGSRGVVGCGEIQSCHWVISSAWIEVDVLLQTFSRDYTYIWVAMGVGEAV